MYLFLYDISCQLLLWLLFIWDDNTEDNKDEHELEFELIEIGDGDLILITFEDEFDEGEEEPITDRLCSRVSFSKDFDKYKSLVSVILPALE